MILIQSLWSQLVLIYFIVIDYIQLYYYNNKVAIFLKVVSGPSDSPGGMPIKSADC